MLDYGPDFPAAESGLDAWIRFWGRILASALGRPLHDHTGGEAGPAFYAAHLARIAATGDDPAADCQPPPVAQVADPVPRLVDVHEERMQTDRRLFKPLKPEFDKRAGTAR